MKIDIRDMMDELCEDTVDIKGNKMAPDDRIKELTMQKIEAYHGNLTQTEKGRAAKPARVLLIAALIVLALGGAALAYTLGAGDFLREFFTGRGSSIGGSQQETMNHIGMVFDGAQESGGTLIRPLSAIADENVYYLMLEVAAPEGTVLPTLPQDEGYYQFDLSLDVGEGLPFGHEMMTQWMPDENPTDGTMQAAILILGDSSGGIRMNDTTSKQLTLTNLYVQTPDKEYKTILEGTWTFDISLFHEGNVVPLDVDGQTVKGPEGSIIHLARAEISPLSLFFSYSYENAPEDMEPGPDPLRVVLKDGTEMSAVGGPMTSGNGEAEGYIVFDAPIALDDVDYVELGGLQLSLPQ